MTPSPTLTKMQAPDRVSPWLAAVSGVLGLCSFVSLVVYITTPSLQMREMGGVAPIGKLLLYVQFLASAAQFLMMIPVSIWLSRAGERRRAQQGAGGMNVGWMSLGVVASGSVGVLRILAMANPAVSDIVFMLPLGLVGVWLAAVNWKNLPALPGWLRVVGGIAGTGLFGVGMNFLFNGGMAVFSQGPMAYGNNVRFHIGLGAFGFPGFTLFALWSILMGLRSIRMTGTREGSA